jgi:uroporphyrinogen III methyltransferase / synthase
MREVDKPYLVLQEIPASVGGLWRRRVLVTRAKEQAGEFCDLLREAGFEPVCLPAISVRPVEDTRPVDEALRNLSRYTWLVFPSGNAVRYLLDRMLAIGRGRADLCHLGVVAGPSTANRLAEHGLTATIIPRPFSAPAALEALRPVVESGSRVLIPRAEGGSDLLAMGLREQGVLVDEVVVYRTEPADWRDKQFVDLARHLAGGGYAAVTFFSPSAVRGLTMALREAAKERAMVMRDLTVACIGRTTAEAAEAEGWRVDVVPGDTTAAAMVAALKVHFESMGSPPRPLSYKGREETRTVSLTGLGGDR